MRVSPTPRSTPIETTWIPSNTWNTPAIGIKVAANPITSGSGVYARARSRGAKLSTRALTDMNPAPTPNPARPARRAAAASPAPTARPTSTEAADDTPSGTMKVSEAMLIAT